VVHGWKPIGTLARETARGSAADRFEYFRADGRQLAPHDAVQLASCLNQGLTRVSDSVVPLHDEKFGEEHTLALISGAAEGKPPPPELAAAAVELLSGTPKGEARVLCDFLRGGSVSIRAAGSGTVAR
jgi:hypothetical protein